MWCDTLNRLSVWSLKGIQRDQTGSLFKVSKGHWNSIVLGHHTLLPPPHLRCVEAFSSSCEALCLCWKVPSCGLVRWCIKIIWLVQVSMVQVCFYIFQILTCVYFCPVWFYSTYGSIILWPQRLRARIGAARSWYQSSERGTIEFCIYIRLPKGWPSWPEYKSSIQNQIQIKTYYYICSTILYMLTWN